MEGSRVYRMYFPPGLKLMLAAMAVVLFGASVAMIAFALFHPSHSGPSVPFAMLLAGVVVVNAVWMLSIPHQMVLSQDGTIEFISVLRQRVFRAAEVKSIKPEGLTFGFVMLRANSGKIRLLTQLDGFHDFLANLKAMNPGIELRGC